MRRRGEVTRPRAVLALMEELGVTEAAKALHVAPGTLHRARNAKEITVAYELAAQAIMDKLKLNVTKIVEKQEPATEPTQEPPPRVEEPAPSEHSVRGMMLVEGPPSKIKALREAAQWLGVKTEE